MGKDLTQIAIVGWGNVGRGVFQAIQQNSDMICSGIITRRVEPVRKELKEKDIENYPIVSMGEVVDAIDGDRKNHLARGLIGQTDVAILCGGSASDLPIQGPQFARGFNTVDSFDTHADILAYTQKMDKIAARYGNTAVVSAGWDPGTFSLERVLGNAFIPQSKAYTFWGPGVSQGHSDAIRRVPGVLDGIQYTMPIGEALKQVRDGKNPDLTTRQKHARVCYVAIGSGAKKSAVIDSIKNMPKYFADYDTTVIVETEKQIAERKKAMPHGGFVMTSGTTGNENNALIEYKNHWESNPEATGSILVACARACNRFNEEGRTGALTMLDIPPTYYSIHSRDKLLKEMM